MAVWQPIETAPEAAEVWTKIDDAGGERNVQTMLRRGRLWWINVGEPGEMCVYYCPTHWAEALPSPAKIGGDA